MDKISEFIDLVWNFLGDVTDNEIHDTITNFFESFFSLFLKWISEGWSFLFGHLMSFVFGILYDNYDSTASTGEYAVSRIFHFAPSSTDAFSVNMIYFYFGCIITIFFLKFIINTILSAIRKL